MARANRHLGCHRKALELDPKLALAHYNLGVALQARGQSDEALACYAAALSGARDFGRMWSC